MIDNLRRTLTAPLALATLVAAWTIPAGVGGVVDRAGRRLGGRAARAAGRRRADPAPPGHLEAQPSARRRPTTSSIAAAQVMLDITFLAHQAWLMVDAIVRTLVRLLVTRRAPARVADRGTGEGRPRSRPRAASTGRWRAASSLAAIAGVLVGVAQAGRGLDRRPVRRAVARRSVDRAADQPARPRSRNRSSSSEQRRPNASSGRPSHVAVLRDASSARNEHGLPPDNFQDDPQPLVAHRTSPTNIGMYLLATVSARDFGWIGTRRHGRTARGDAGHGRATRTIPRSPLQLVRHADPAAAGARVRLDRRQRQPRRPSARRVQRLPPDDRSAAARRAPQRPASATRWRSPDEAAGDGQRDAPDPHRRDRSTRLDEWSRQPGAVVVGRAGARRTTRIIRRRAWRERTSTSWRRGPTPPARRSTAIVRDLSLLGSVDGVERRAHVWPSWPIGRGHEHATPSMATLVRRLQALADEAQRLVAAMDFGFLFDPVRKLFSIGFRVREGTLDPSYYDLLASEARLTSFVAIAKGDVEADHWFRLGRGLTPVGRGSALISWSGSMFEYLMPSLVMRAPVGSLLEQTSRLVVARQIRYAAERGVPWGISESGYNARDLDADVSVLGIRRSRPRRSSAGSARTWSSHRTPRARGDGRSGGRGAELRPSERRRVRAGRYGFREALDYTPRRLPSGASVAVVKSYMAHHQGMTLVALGNVVNDDSMVERFHADPIVEATELLLQERMPRNALVVATTRRGGEERRRRARLGAADPAPVHVAARHDPADAPAVERAVLRDGHDRRVGLQPVASTWRSRAGVRTSRAIRGAASCTCATPSTRSGLVGRIPAGRPRGRHLRGVVQRGPGDVRPPRRIDHDRLDGHGVRRGRRRDPARVAHQSRLASPRARAHVVSGAGAGTAGGRRRPPGVPEPVRPDRVRCRDRRAARHAPAAFERRGADLGGARGDGRGPRRRRHPVRDRPGPLPRPRPLGALGGVAWSTGARCRTPSEPCSTRSSACAAASSSNRARRCTRSSPPWSPSRASRCSTSPTSIGLRRTFERARILAWTHAQVQLHHLGIDAGEAQLFQRLANRILYSDPSLRPPPNVLAGNRRGAPGAVAARHLRRPADRGGSHRPARRRRHRSAAAAGARVLAPQAARRRSRDHQRARRHLRRGPPRLARERWCGRASRRSATRAIRATAASTSCAASGSAPRTGRCS